LGTPACQSYTITQSLQFPGKGLLQGKLARRTADISQLVYQAMLRDVRAQVQTAYYQLQLDLGVERPNRRERGQPATGPDAPVVCRDAGGVSGGKADFTTLITTFQQRSGAQSIYLQAVNQLLAGKVALEQAAGGSLE